MEEMSRALECLEGLAVGDGLGQCFFRLPVEEAERVLAGEMLPEGPWYYTDDTEMSLSVVAALIRGGADGIDAEWLAQSFAARYDYDRAYGPAMHRALARIREGEAWREVSGSLFGGQGSFGNGAAMRSAPIGAWFAGQPERLVENAVRAAEITHCHPEAIAGAIAVAAAAGVAVEMRRAGVMAGHRDFLAQVIALTPAGEVRDRLLKAQAMEQVASVRYPASILGDGTEMSAADTVPYALWCCAQAPGDYERAVRLGLEGGVDRDTIAAIIGGVVVCFTGVEQIPAEWQQRREALPDWHLER